MTKPESDPLAALREADRRYYMHELAALRAAVARIEGEIRHQCDGPYEAIDILKLRGWADDLRAAREPNRPQMSTHVCCGCGGLCDSGHPCPMAYNCKCRRESEDSHAALAAEMRQPPGFWHPKAPEWAARVEQLGQDALNRYQEATHDYFELKHKAEAREAEIAKVRTLLIVMADHEPNDDRKVYINSLAARLGGTA